MTIFRSVYLQGKMGYKLVFMVYGMVIIDKVIAYTESQLDEEP